MPAHKARVESLYRLHFGELIQFLAQRVSCPQLANDLVQELFLRLLTRGAATRAIQHDRGFLYQSARNLAAEARRSPRWRDTPLADLADDELIYPGAPPDAIAENKQALARLLDIIGDLPPRCRQAFTLHKLDGLSYKEVAARLDISVSAVEKHLMRALNACRNGRKPLPVVAFVRARAASFNATNRAHRQAR
jgi:RNA polymerase sigma factor (sigma-70 family)